MTTPASNTPNGIITDAMHDAGYLQEGQLPSSEKLVEHMRRLQDIINFEQTQGLKLWLQEFLPFSGLEVGTSAYTVGAAGPIGAKRYLRILQADFVDQTAIRRPLVLLSAEEWLRLSQVSGNNGQINSYFVQKSTTTLTLNVWNPPDAVACTGSLLLLAEAQVTNPISLTETMQFPPEWRIFLRWALADDIATGQPQAIMDRCKERAGFYRAALEDWDVEDAPTYFQPDSRMAQTTSGFR